ncbi:MAG: hypothetical protein J2P15_22965, partial [Micromonosporaceae bacterium]|nr:hypothetical protein [Micromonosporaceae bacterium]
MPSPEHEILIEMFRERPAFAAEVLAHVLGVEVPPFQTAQLSSDELTDIAPTEYRADAVVTFSVDGRPVLAVVIEVQLRVDARKRRSWPVYVATLHARLGCPVRLLVVCPGAAVAAWCAAAIVAGDLVLRPRVLGPRQVPLVTDPLVARDSPHLAVLSAMAHGSRPDPDPVFEALLTALSVVDQDHADLY